MLSTIMLKRFFSSSSGSSSHFHKLLRGSTNHSNLVPFTRKIEEELKISHSIYPLSNGKRALVHLKFFSPPSSSSSSSSSDDTTLSLRPTNFILAIDRSGSMSEPCTYEGNADKESSKYSRMDLVKHSANTIIECLRPEDSLSIISFDTNAEMVYHLSEMTDGNKKNVRKSLETVNPRGMTNLWDGLRLSMEQFSPPHHLLRKDQNNFIILLSDGIPNQNPPRGIIAEFLEKIAKEKDSFHYSINHFGYGYQLEGDLLSNLAMNGGGLFAHIPDHSMCNTVFINFLTNCLLTVINKIKLQVKSIDTPKTVSKVQVANHSLINNSYYDLGPVQSGLQRNVLLLVENHSSKFVTNIIEQFSDNPSASLSSSTSSAFEFTLKLNIDGSEIDYPIKGNYVSSPSGASLTNGAGGVVPSNYHVSEVEQELATILYPSKRIVTAPSSSSSTTNSTIDRRTIEERSDMCYVFLIHHLIEILTHGLNHQKVPITETCQALDQYYLLVEDVIQATNHPPLKESLLKLLKNIKEDNPNDIYNAGQIYKAFSKSEWYHRWGCHYIRYLISSLSLEKCSNFKDLIFEKYTTEQFHQLRNEIEEIFFSIPIPTPSLSTEKFQGNFAEAFYSPSGPCFDGNGIVKTYNPSTGLYEDRFVKELRKGDKIKNADQQIATIRCVLKTKIHQSKAVMNEFNGMKITPWHPIRLPLPATRTTTSTGFHHQREWKYPITLQADPPKEVAIDWFYDFVLDQHHIITINDIDVICLGHGITDDPILNHPFFGTQKVIEELQKDAQGWEKGEIVILDYKPVYQHYPSEPQQTGNHQNQNTGRIVDGFSL